MSTTPIATLPAYLEEVLRIAHEFNEAAAPKRIDGPWFRGASDRSNGLTPGAYWRTDLNETELVVDFIDRAPPHLEARGTYQQAPSDTLWNWYFLMQHYGMPTRLLDWTENALTGLFFALSSEKAVNPCVWMLNPEKFNKSTTGDVCVISPGGKFSDHWLPIASEDQDVGCRPACPTSFDYKGQKHTNEKPLAIFAARRNARVLVQQGTFTVHGTDRRSMHIMISEGDSSTLRCILIERSACKRLLKELEVCGIVDAWLFPELERLAADIKRRHSISP